MYYSFCQAPDNLWCLFFWIILSMRNPYQKKNLLIFIYHSYKGDQENDVHVHQNTPCYGPVQVDLGQLV